MTACEKTPLHPSCPVSVKVSIRGQLKVCQAPSPESPSLGAGHSLGLGDFAVRGAAMTLPSKTLNRQSKSSRGTKAPTTLTGEVEAERGRPAGNCPTCLAAAGFHLAHICFVETELALAQRENSQDADKELKGRTSQNLGLSRVESVGRNLLKSDTLGKKPYAPRECGRDLARSQNLPAPRGHTLRRNQKSQFIGNR